jgi:hypothetical protein
MAMDSGRKLFKRDWPLLLSALFALGWIVHRAHIQSITFDEANTYHAWVAANWANVWYPNSNNHVLNTILIRLFVGLFGLSELTMRAPALMGGAIYIFSAYRLCTLLSSDVMLSWPLFACFIYNPFVMDYLVAARGYELAIGFFTLAVYLTVRTMLFPNETETLWRVAATSLCAGLSFCASISFALANAAVIALLFVYAFSKSRKRSLLFVSCVVPGLLVALVLTGPMLAKLPRSELFWGAHSLKEMWGYVYRASFPPLALPGSSAHKLTACLLDAVGLSLAIYSALQFRNGKARSRLLIAGSMAGALGVTVLAHSLEFEFFQIPLPLDRTSLFVVPLLMVTAGAVFSVAPITIPERMVRGIGSAALFVCAIYFLCSLRDFYFQEWKGYGADVSAAFPTIVEFSHREGIREIQGDWKYVPSLNFYRALYAGNWLDEFKELDKTESPQRAYILPENEYKEFVGNAGLHVIYRGAISDLVVVTR